MARFFSFDGIDGAGKSTQLRLFCDWLREQRIEPVVCRDPGGTALGERVRDLLLNSGHDTPIGPRCEMLLYMASRAQLVEEVIGPALAAGRTVVCDRFLLANVVYQGYAGGLAVEEVRRVGAVAVRGVLPDCTFLLDLDPATAFQRMGRQLDRVERRGADYRRRVREGFLAEAAVMGARVEVINADRPASDVHAAIVALAGQRLAENRDA